MKAVNSYLQEMLAAVDPGIALGREMTMLDALDGAARKVDEGAFRYQPAVEADVRMTFGNTYVALGLYSKAEGHAAALNSIAWALLTCEIEELRDPEAALPIAQRAVEQSGGRKPDILDTLARAYCDSGDFERAVEAQRKAVWISHAEDAIDPAALEERLAGYLLKRELPAGLVARFFEWAVPRDLEGGEAGKVLLRMALALELGGLHTQAEVFLRECLRIRREVLPETHFAVADTLLHLAEVMAKQGKFAAAESLLPEGWGMVKRSSTLNRSKRDRYRKRIIRFYELWGKPDEAQAWTRR